MANTSLLKPTSVEVALSENNPNRAVITLEPFERGYGHTLGNALRRILLSSMIGFAPTEVQITGIVHEYSQIDGVLEDVVDILLNLKGVVFKLDGRDDAPQGRRRRCDRRRLRSSPRRFRRQSRPRDRPPLRRSSRNAGQD